jgi:hypothetical protein
MTDTAEVADTEADTHMEYPYADKDTFDLVGRSRKSVVEAGQCPIRFRYGVQLGRLCGTCANLKFVENGPRTKEILQAV